MRNGQFKKENTKINMKNIKITLYIFTILLLANVNIFSQWQRIGEIKLKSGETKVIEGTVRPGQMQSYGISVGSEDNLTVTLTNIKGTAAYGIGYYVEEGEDIISLDAYLFPKLKLSENDHNFLPAPLTRIYKDIDGDYSLVIKSQQKIAATYKIVLKFGKSKPQPVSTPNSKPVSALNSNEISIDACSTNGDAPILFKIGSFNELKGKYYENQEILSVTSEAMGIGWLRVENTLVADIDNDGKEEGLAHIICNWGGTGDFHYIAAYEISGNRYRKLASMDKESFPKPQVDKVENISFKDGKFFITFVEHPGRAYPKTNRRTFAYTLENRLVREDSVNKPVSKMVKKPAIETPPPEKAVPVIKTVGKQTLRKDKFTIDINGDWKILEEPNNGFVVAAPGMYVMKNNRPEISFGLFCGVTDAVVSGVKGVLNVVTETELQANLKDATKSYLKALTKSNKMKKTGDSENTFLSGQPALLTKYESTSAQTGKPENVFVYTTLLPNRKMFFLVEITPADGNPEYRQVFEDIKKSLRFK